MSLNEPQKRRVTITLRMLEQELALMERIIESGEEGVLYRRANSLDERQKERLRAMASRVRDVLHRLKERFALPVDEDDTQRILLAHFSRVWIDLEETRPKELRGSGAVDPKLYETLEPDIDTLIQLVGVIRSVLV